MIRWNMEHVGARQLSERPQDGDKPTNISKPLFLPTGAAWNDSAAGGPAGRLQRDEHELPNDIGRAARHARMKLGTCQGDARLSHICMEKSSLLI